MMKAYPNSNLNSILARWILPGPGLVRDCAGCSRPAKCCDFQPFVPNFLLGGWLARESALPFIKNVYFTPIGAIPRPEYRLAHEQGQSSLCGFYEGGRCRLWRFRPVECSTYFCDAERPTERDSGFAVELAVAQMALVELGLSAQEISDQVDLVNGAPAQEYAGHSLLVMYKKAWTWSLSLPAETVRSWI